MLDGTYIFECACYSNEHGLRFVYNEEEKEVYATMFMFNWPQWYKRVWVSIKYIFGYKRKYSHWDLWIMRHEDLDRFISLFTTMKEDMEKVML